MTELSQKLRLRAWVALIVLTGLGTVLSLVPGVGRASDLAGLAILALAWAKTRIILLDYLGLRAAPSWRRGGVAALSFVALLFAGLYMAG